jgi:hypothetical protein
MLGYTVCLLSMLRLRFTLGSKKVDNGTSISGYKVLLWIFVIFVVLPFLINLCVKYSEYLIVLEYVF